MSHPIEKQIINKLQAAFSPIKLEVCDDSDKHKGHGGYKEGGGTHFSILIVSNAFEGISRVERQRKVFEVLKQEMDEHIHALSINAKSSLEV